MPGRENKELSRAGFFVSHTLQDAEYCRLLILPAIEAVVDRGFNQYVFMDYENFGRGHKSDGTNANLFAAAYAREIERLLDDSHAMILVASLAAIRSDWVKREVDWWVRNRELEQLVVIVKEPCDLSLLNSAVTRCLQYEMYNPLNVHSRETLHTIVGGLMPR